MTTHTQPPFIPQQSAPTQAPLTPNQSTGFPVASLILGIVSLLGLGLLTGIPAIVFGAIALKRKQPEHGMSLAGVITGSIGTLLSLLFIAFIIIMMVVGYNSEYYNTPIPPYDGYAAPIENPRT